jgi:plasmid maintenance system antidote protein VapI
MKHTPRRYRATHVAETIRDQGRTVAWLARRIGWSRQYTSGVVHGHIDVREEVARQIADVIGVPIFLLFELSGGTVLEPSSSVEAVA